ncbi:MAG: hemerythrin family protein [Rhodospirillales bacterium]|nr:hemerythrin family protein [Rhodospirillales bacterium]
MNWRTDPATKEELNKELIWSAKYSVGDVTLDQDHMMVFNAIDRFKKAIRLNFEVDFVETLFDQLREHADEHFAQEEGYMEKIGFPELESHRAEHEKMKSELNTLHERFSVEKEDTVRELLSFLNNWWLRHITEDDAAYKDFAK